MKFAIRVDDFGWKPTKEGKERDLGLQEARRFHECFAGFPYLGAVIPADADEEGRAWIATKPAGLTVALHGWDHSTPGGARNEFEGFSIDAMREKLEAGQKRVGPTPHFVPPFNSISPGLAEACFHEGVRYIWGAPVRWDTPPSPIELDKGVRFLPSWDRFYAATRWQQGDQAPLLAQLSGNWWKSAPGLACITLHITWELARDHQLRGVRELVSLVAEHLVTPYHFAEACR